jgi:hypothetical protein
MAGRVARQRAFPSQSCPMRRTWPPLGESVLCSLALLLMCHAIGANAGFILGGAQLSISRNVPNYLAWQPDRLHDRVRCCRVIGCKGPDLHDR